MVQLKLNDVTVYTEPKVSFNSCMVQLKFFWAKWMQTKDPRVLIPVWCN